MPSFRGHSVLRSRKTWVPKLFCPCNCNLRCYSMMLWIPWWALTFCIPHYEGEVSELYSYPKDVLPVQHYQFSTSLFSTLHSPNLRRTLLTCSSTRPAIQINSLWCFVHFSIFGEIRLSKESYGQPETNFYNIFLVGLWFYTDSTETCMPEKTIW